MPAANRITAVTRWPLEQSAAVARAQTELSAIWFWRRVGFWTTPELLTIQAKAQEVLRSKGKQQAAKKAGDDMLTICLCKGSERYIIVYDDECKSRSEALRTLGRWASNPELSFTWHDAAVLSNRIREQSQAEHRT